MHLILNEPDAPQELLQQPPDQLIIEPQKLITKKQNFIILPLTEKYIPPNQPSSSQKHPTYLLKNFPHRPHYYQTDSVGAQPGYCLSPVPPCLRQFTNLSSSSSTSTIPHLSSQTRNLKHNATTGSSHSLVSSSATLSSLPSLSTTVASSTSSSSPPLSSTSLLKLSQSITHLSVNSTLQRQPSSQENQPSSLSTLVSSNQTASPGMITTKKVLPIPPSLSPRVRQIFLDKIGIQHAQSCAQLPRRKKKKPVTEPAIPPV